MSPFISQYGHEAEQLVLRDGTWVGVGCPLAEAATGGSPLDGSGLASVVRAGQRNGRRRHGEYQGDRDGDRDSDGNEADHGPSGHADSVGPAMDPVKCDGLPAEDRTPEGRRSQRQGGGRHP